MLDGHVKSYSDATGTGVITPVPPGADVLFLAAVVEGPGTPTVGRPVQYELYDGDGEPEAKRVVLC